jgi:uncharacterized membrane protein
MARGIGWGLATGIGGTFGTIALSQAFALGGEASVIAPLTAMYPLVTVVLALMFLRERLNLVQGVGIALALGTILLFSSMDAPVDGAAMPASLFAPWMLSGLLALTLFGIQGITQKMSTRYISNELATICYWLVSVLASVGIVITQPFDWTLPPTAWMVTVGAGVLMGVAIWVGLAAYREGKASVVTAVIALYPMLTVALAVPILGDTLTPLKGIAIVLAILAGLALTYERPASTTPPVPADG